MEKQVEGQGKCPDEARRKDLPGEQCHEVWREDQRMERQVSEQVGGLGSFFLCKV